MFLHAQDGQEASSLHLHGLGKLKEMSDALREAKEQVASLEARCESLQQSLGAASRSDEQLRRDNAMLRGQNETLLRQLSLAGAVVSGAPGTPLRVVPDEFLETPWANDVLASGVLQQQRALRGLELLQERREHAAAMASLRAEIRCLELKP